MQSFRNFRKHLFYYTKYIIDKIYSVTFLALEQAEKLDENRKIDRIISINLSNMEEEMFKHRLI